MSFPESFTCTARSLLPGLGAFACPNEWAFFGTSWAPLGAIAATKAEC